MPFFEKRFADIKEKNRFQFMAQDLTKPSPFLSELIGRTDAVILSNILHLIPPDNRDILLKMLCDYMKDEANLIMYDQFVSAELKIDAAGFMVVDWVNCGSVFNLNEDDFAADLKKIGFVQTKTGRFSNLPGALVCGYKK